VFSLCHEDHALCACYAALAMQVVLASRGYAWVDALTHVLLHESQAQPLLLVFEDPYWIDTETQALLESLPTAHLLLTEGPLLPLPVLAELSEIAPRRALT
jgi:hypothetical protein